MLMFTAHDRNVCFLPTSPPPAPTANQRYSPGDYNQRYNCELSENEEACAEVSYRQVSGGRVNWGCAVEEAIPGLGEREDRRPAWSTELSGVLLRETTRVRQPSLPLCPLTQPCSFPAVTVLARSFVFLELSESPPGMPVP